MKRYGITIDIGGTKVLLALVNEKSKIIKNYKTSTVVIENSKSMIKKIVDSINYFIITEGVKQSELKYISIGIPGTVDIKKGKIIRAPNLKLFNFDIRKEFQKHFPNTTLFLDNDVNMTALGINKYELKNPKSNSIVVSVGTGIGSAFIFNGKIYRGSSYFAGEIGQLKIDMTNSQSASFETLASRLGIVNGIINDFNNGESTLLEPHILENKKIKSKVLTDALIKNDELTKKHLIKSAELIGLVLSNIVNLLNLDTIFLSGGVVNSLKDFMVPEIKKVFEANVIPESGKVVKIKASKLGDRAPLLGGIALAEEHNK